MGCSLNTSLFRPPMASTAQGKNPQQRVEKSGENPTIEKQREALRRHDDEVEAKVIAHEMAHAAIAGNAPVYDYNARGRIVGGHVPVSLNGNDRSSLEKAKAAAEAPGGDMSGQDAAVASKADAILKDLDARASQGKAQLALQKGFKF